MVKEYRGVIDRTGWKSGEWDDEPDKIQWTDKMTGMACLIVRHALWGHLCGYVGVEPDHPLYGEAYQDAEGELEEGVHGGLTYCGHCQKGSEEETICHVPEPGKPDNLFWFGFDCSHAWDIHPHGFPFEKDVAGVLKCGIVVSYKNIEFVKAECAELARQLKEMKSVSKSGDAAAGDS